jgi:hypothetical protein
MTLEYVGELVVSALETLDKTFKSFNDNDDAFFVSKTDTNTGLFLAKLDIYIKSNKLIVDNRRTIATIRDSNGNIRLVLLKNTKPFIGVKGMLIMKK